MIWSTRQLLPWMAAVGLLLGGCAEQPSRVQTTAALDAVLADPSRPAADRARDVWRHPRQTLLFFGLRNDLAVVEIAPGGSGWYTQILAPLLREHGRLIAAVDPRVPGNAYSERESRAFRDLLASDPARFDRIEVVDFTPGGAPIAPDASLDVVLTFRNLHNWMARGTAEAAIADFYRVLKPGGVLGVVDHRGNPSIPQDPKAATGYVNQSYAVRMIETAGFRLVGVSEVNANPQDTKDHGTGVWSLPPTYADGDKDRARYAAIGESDRFTLKFVKPRK
jgi:predicted methyltransferase